MDTFLNDFESGAIHFKDKWEFELKSEFIPHPPYTKNTYTQEVYIFIPNSLQINSETYSKQEFYRNLTNFFRYKTPVFTFAELNDLENTFSPLARIFYWSDPQLAPSKNEKIEYELKLLGNIVRSLLRDKAVNLSKKIEFILTQEDIDKFKTEVDLLCTQMKKFLSLFQRVKKKTLQHIENRVLAKHFSYVEAFIENSVDHYFTGLLKKIFDHPLNELKASSSELIEIIASVRHQKENFMVDIEKIQQDEPSREFILYRAGLLNKYVLDALLLNITKKSSEQKFQEVIGGFAAGLAMFVYFGLFVWQTQTFGRLFFVHTELFILATVVLYILKDRLKEAIKTVSYKLAFRWFSDYTTEIRSSNDKNKLGYFKESFSFIEPQQLPDPIKEIRNQEFHSILEDFARPENVIYYKKKIEMLHHDSKKVDRKYSLNVISKFSIFRFLEKADDAMQSYLVFNDKTLSFNTLKIPKVYHINIILKNSFIQEDGSFGTELKKFRLIIDKEGIKRIEHVKPLSQKLIDEASLKNR